MKLLGQVRQVARARHLPLRTEQCFARRGESFIRFHSTSDVVPFLAGPAALSALARL